MRRVFFISYILDQEQAVSVPALCVDVAAVPTYNTSRFELVKFQEAIQPPLAATANGT